MGRLRRRVVILRNELLMEELISTEPLTLAFLMTDCVTSLCYHGIGIILLGSALQGIS